MYPYINDYIDNDQENWLMTATRKIKGLLDKGQTRIY